MLLNLWNVWGQMIKFILPKPWNELYFTLFTPWRLKDTTLAKLIGTLTSQESDMPRKTNWLKNKSIFLFGISWMAAWMFVLSLTVPHLNLCIMCVIHIEFHIESEIIFCQCSCTQTTPNLVTSRWCLPRTASTYKKF